MENFSKTKLIITYGPSLDAFFGWDLKKKPAKLTTEQINKYKDLYNKGVNVIRFNLSHDSFENHEYRFNQFRQLIHKTKLIIGLLIDTKGPEIRIGQIQKTNLKNNLIHQGSTVKLLTTAKCIGDAKHFFVSDVSGKYNLANDVDVNDHILVDDGKLILEVKSISKDKNEIITTSLSKDYYITTNKRINLFNKKYSLPFLSDYDVKTITWATKIEADYIALSFVSNLDEIKSVKEIIAKQNKNSKLKVICKIETPEAVNNLETLIINSDGVMVARGDLSLEVGYYKVPEIQDDILHLCNIYNKISIVATQMLDSLETKLLPTRAEVTDCYYAAKSFCDSTMMSSETAAGIDPINAIEVMKKITDYAEINIAKSINFSAIYVQSKFIKHIFKKINNRAIEQKDILLKGFSEEEIRQISNSMTNKNFYINPDNYSYPGTLTLYKNLNFIDKNDGKTLHVVTKK